VLEVEVALQQPVPACLREGLGDVLAVAIATADRHVDELVEPAAEQLDIELVRAVDPRDADRVDRDDYDLLMQRVVVGN
jgi:hypothetical protein